MIPFSLPDVEPQTRKTRVAVLALGLMVPPPGTLLEPAEVQIGALVDARDDSGIWYRARVIEKTGRGARTSVTVRFQRFNQKHDRKFKKSHQAIRVRLSSAALRAEQDVTQWGGRNDGRRDDGFWEVERIIKVRKQGSRREYFVEWTGWEAEYNSWTKDVSRDLIDEYQGEQVALAKLRERPPKYPKGGCSQVRVLSRLIVSRGVVVLGNWVLKRQAAPRLGTRRRVQVRPRRRHSYTPANPNPHPRHPGVRHHERSCSSRSCSPAQPVL